MAYLFLKFEKDFHGVLVFFVLWTKTEKDLALSDNRLNSELDDVAQGLEGPYNFRVMIIHCIYTNTHCSILKKIKIIFDFTVNYCQ